MYRSRYRAGLVAGAALICAAVGVATGSTQAATPSQRRALLPMIASDSVAGVPVMGTPVPTEIVIPGPKLTPTAEVPGPKPPEPVPNSY